MRWKVFRRRLSVNSSRFSVRTHTPWPMRWALSALVLGFSAALALWAFEIGKELSGVEVGAHEELAKLREEIQKVRSERDAAQSVANTADSLLKTEKATQDRLAAQVHLLEEQNLALIKDVRFYEKLVPSKQRPTTGAANSHPPRKAP
ncbi:hypothetical protein [Leptothrix ochracea]|uniref:hypothetical protein n=1 Tax=Leptothrix ochracea TaxID=735331 RepID=UPI0034E27481